VPFLRRPNIQGESLTPGTLRLLPQLKNNYHSVRSHLISAARIHIGTLYGLSDLQSDTKRLQLIDELLANDVYILREDERKLAPGVSHSHNS